MNLISKNRSSSSVQNSEIVLLRVLDREGVVEASDADYADGEEDDDETTATVLNLGGRRGWRRCWTSLSWNQPCAILAGRGSREGGGEAIEDRRNIIPHQTLINGDCPHSSNANQW